MRCAGRTEAWAGPRRGPKLAAHVPLERNPPIDRSGDCRRRRVLTRFGGVAGLPAATRGALFMLAAAVSFSAIVVFVREATGELHPFVVAFWRNVFGFLFVLPWLVHLGGVAILRTGRQGLILLRAIFGIAAMLSWFTALSLLPIAEAVSLSFTTPLFATVGAALILRETVRARRWSATAIGFVGVLVILRPGAAVIDPAAFLVLGSALALAISMMIIKVVSRTVASGAIVAWTMVYLIAFSAGPALAFWEWPDARGWALLVGAGAAGTFGHLAFTQALKVADASAVVPLDYVRLPLVALAGYWLYGEVMDLWGWVGAGIIAGSVIYIARREIVVARQRAGAGVVTAGRDSGAERL